MATTTNGDALASSTATRNLRTGSGFGAGGQGNAGLMRTEQRGGGASPQVSNGCRGVLVDVEKTADGRPKRLVIKFKNPEHGRLQREKNPCHRHPDATYIDPILWRYILGGATATIFQFPVRGAAGMSAHKIQVHY